MDNINHKKRWFFGLCRELKIDVNEAKRKAKEKFNLKSFSDIKEYQLDYLINILVEKKTSLSDYSL